MQINRIKRRFILFIMCFTIILISEYSFAGYYVHQPLNIAFLKKKNDNALIGIVGTSLFTLQGSYSPINHLQIGVSGNYIKRNYSVQESTTVFLFTSRSVDVKHNQKSVEFITGFYDSVNTKKVVVTYNFFGGYNFSNVHHTIEHSKKWTDTLSVNVKHYFIQAGISLHRKLFEAGMSCKFGIVNFDNMSYTTLSNEVPKSKYSFVNLAGFFSVGNKTKFYLQGSMEQFINSSDDDEFIFPVTFGIGISHTF